jgi:hypothetical protein
MPLAAEPRPAQTACDTSFEETHALAEQSATALRNDIDAAWDAYIGELRQHGDGWERRPAASADGEGAWNARQVAEHIAGASGYFGSQIAAAIEAEPLQMQRFTFETAGEAAEATPGAHAALMGVVAKVEDSHLDTQIEFPPLGTQTVAQIVGVIAYHLRDHANQLKTLREG